MSDIYRLDDLDGMTVGAGSETTNPSATPLGYDPDNPDDADDTDEEVSY